jgi:threonine dehydratase
VEPEGSPTLAACLKAGKKVRLDAVTSRVATMSCRETDERIFRIVEATVDDIVLVSDDAMLEASRWLWSEFGIAADLSGAASIAALRRWPDRMRGSRRVCALVCGAGSDGIGG